MSDEEKSDFRKKVEYLVEEKDLEICENCGRVFDKGTYPPQGIDLERAVNRNHLACIFCILDLYEENAREDYFNLLVSGLVRLAEDQVLDEQVREPTFRNSGTWRAVLNDVPGLKAEVQERLRSNGSDQALAHVLNKDDE